MYMKKIATPVVNGSVNEHFGHSDEFQIFLIDDNNQVQAGEVLITANGCGCKSNLVEELQTRGVSVVLTGNLGQGAKEKLDNAGIEVLTGFSGSAEDAAKSWAAGNYKVQPILSHGGHNHGHACNHN